MSALYEAQDVLAGAADVDLIYLEQDWSRRINPSWLRLPLYHDMSKKLMFVNPGLRKVRLTQDYDLFVAVFQNYWDLPYINAIHEWRNHSKTSVCWIDEIWTSSIPGYKYWLHALSQFDYVFVGCRGSVGPLSEAINRQCHWLPPAVDALRFSPYPKAPERVVDVLSIGRRREGIHQAFLHAASQTKIFYVYDTARGAANGQVYGYQQHRDFYANMAKRSHYFVVAPALMDNRNKTKGQIEFGYRFYEGAAAGTVMIGEKPNCEAFMEMFPWSDAVIPINPDGSDAIKVITDLASDPDRISDIRRRNAIEALLRHDWIYRWKEMFRILEIKPTPDMVKRESHLRDLAKVAMDGHVTKEPVLGHGKL